jgi:hypothetical protein
MSLNADHLLTDTCTLESHTANTYDADTGNQSVTYGAAQSLKCMPVEVDFHWRTRWPEVSLTRALRMYLPARTTVEPEDRITWDSNTYRVLAVYPHKLGGVVQYLRVDLEREDGLDT